MSIEEVKEAAIRYAQEAYPEILEERGDIGGIIMGASANGFVAGVEFAQRCIMGKGNLVSSLMSAQEHMLGQYGIRVASVAGNGIVKIAFDSDIMDEMDCKRYMDECGIREYEMSADLRSSSIFITIKP
jgi:hypothetical protein